MVRSRAALIGVFLAGFLIGELDPVGWVVLRLVGTQLPAMKVESLAAPSPFQEFPKSRWIAESPGAFAVDDQYAPMAPVHALVIPKERHPTVLDAPVELQGEMLDLARQVARERGITEDGFRIQINVNPRGGQTVYHLHMHVLGGRQMGIPMLRWLWSRLTHL